MFIVMEECLDYSVPLRLEFGEGLPRGSVLSWLGNSSEAVTVFETRAEARAAIRRTDLYRRACGYTEPGQGFPRAADCRVVPLRMAAKHGGGS